MLNTNTSASWENEFPQLFRGLPNFHGFLYNSIETRGTCFLFLLDTPQREKGKRLVNFDYSIASRATQSNSVYVSVLKIPIVLADGVSKSTRQNCFFLRERQLLARGKILYFATIIDTNRDSAHHSQSEDNFATFSLGLEFLNVAEKEKNNGKGDSASVTSRFASLNNHL